ncbi:phenylacetate--CoA ligase family protein [Mesorhizobium sp. 2RAF21]|uniref:phenylacetate--CoA ligase family protein n=1 Tax=Mesorhizobium sp. 2RAF21 TaxID=3232995 RepID=UPI003F995329
MTYPSLLHPDVETLSPDNLACLQNLKWEKQRQYLAGNSSFYQSKLGGALKKEMTLDNLQDVSLTDKDELRASQENDYPFGNYVACSPDKVVRIHRTSGTTGRALILANSAKDADIIAEQGARGMWASGLRPSDRVVHCLNYQMWTGGLTDHMTLEATGATVLPYGIGGTKRLVEVIRDLGINVISSTPSYPALLEKTLREDFDLKPRDLGLRLALFGGEAGLDNAAFRQAMEETWGFEVRNANFGLSEVMSTMGSQCEHTTDLHFLSGDVLFLEVLDTRNGQRLKLEDGTTGELVCTHLEKECQPLIRYRTRDVITITGTEQCSCGRRSFRFRVTGRTDDMFNVRGVNVFPSAIHKVITSAQQLASGHFRIVLDGPGPYDRVKVLAEAAAQVPQQDWNGVARELEKRIRDTIGASADIDIVPFESLPRTDGKTSLIERV